MQAWRFRLRFRLFTVQIRATAYAWRIRGCSNNRYAAVNQTFPIFLIGYLVLIAGVAYGMHAAGLGMQWIITAVLILAGIAIVGSMTRAKRDGDGTNGDAAA